MNRPEGRSTGGDRQQRSAAPWRVVGSLFLAALVGCGSVGARRPDTVIIASGADLQSMNSLVTTHPLARQVQRYALLTTLVRYDSALHVEPYLARRWVWTPDSLALGFVLRNDVRWHDGRPTTARDVVFTLRTALDPTTGYPRWTDLADVDRVEMVDDTVAWVRFSRPQVRIPDVLTDLAILPYHLLGGTAPSEMRRAAWNERPVGNGPFRFVRHEANRRWVFEANPGFPPALGGRPRIGRLVVAVVDEPMTKLAALTAAELDFAGIQPAHAWFVSHDPDLRVLDYPLLFSYAIVFNTRRPPFDRLENRRAVGLAIDRLAISSGYLFGFGVPAAGPLPPELGGDTTRPLYAPGRAKALLEDSLRFELLTVGSGEAALEQMIQQQLARVGIQVTIRQLELASFLERVQAGRDFEAAVMGIPGDLQLGYLRTVLRLSGMNAEGAGADLVPVLRDSVPATFLYHARGVQGMNRRMEGVRMDLRGELAGLGDWRIVPR